ncbi:MAG: hypothetical protein H6618_04960 [Deltaproteobacteria bacterium]|nr:hypothetical protein [Deltaproteobacteria bacterium]
MKVKAKVCVVDEDDQVRAGWEQALNGEITLLLCRDFDQLMEEAGQDASLLASLDCLITGRYFEASGLDICNSPLIKTLRNAGVGAIFLNWQGYLTKEQIEASFDGRLFNRYGVRWQTLRSRVQKIRGKQPQTALSPEGVEELSQNGAKKGTHKSRSSAAEKKQEEKARARQTAAAAAAAVRTKPQRCQELLRCMATKAAGHHREKLEYYASHNHQEGIALLEAIYNRLMISSQGEERCPSRYINSSPVVAKSILRQALFG